MTEDNGAAKAVIGFVYLQTGRSLDYDTVSRKIGSVCRDGASHASVQGYLDYLFRYDGFSVAGGFDCLITDVTLPLLVHYSNNGISVYGIVTKISLRYDSAREGEVEIIDSEREEGIVVGWQEFVANWYSPRYGKNWGLYVQRKVK